MSDEKSPIMVYPKNTFLGLDECVIKTTIIVFIILYLLYECKEKFYVSINKPAKMERMSSYVNYDRM